MIMKRTGLLAVLLILPLMACYDDNYGHMRGMGQMMNYGYGYGHGYGGMLLWVFIILLICVVVYLVIKKKKL
jgi:hypothetical protein